MAQTVISCIKQRKLYIKKNRKTLPQDFFPPKSLAKCVVVCVIARRKPNLLKRVLCFQTVCDRQSQKPGGGGRREDWFAVLRRLFGFFVSCLSCDETSTPSRRPNVVSSPPLITSCYGLALFSCLQVNKPSCLPVLIRGEFLHQPPPTEPPPPSQPSWPSPAPRHAGGTPLCCVSVSRNNQQHSRQVEPLRQSKLCVNL